MKTFLKEECGATAIEYGLVASLIAAAVVGVMWTLWPPITALFQ
jgi:pilus assembly protein Flp/PilA